MRKILSAMMIACICFAFTSCGNGALSGDPATFYNSNKSFSIELPSSGEDSWTINEEADGDILNITDANDIVNIQIQCLSKNKALPVATNLEDYKNHVITTTFEDIFSDTALSDTDVEVPDFMINSTAANFTAKKDTEGLVIFMESEQCYYTYLILTAEGGYEANKKSLMQSIMSLKELTEIP